MRRSFLGSICLCAVLSHFLSAAFLQSWRLGRRLSAKPRSSSPAERSWILRASGSELTDLYGMKTRELKAFLKGKGVAVDDCFDSESLIARAAESDIWQRSAAPQPAPSPAPSSPSQGDRQSTSLPSREEVEEAWRGIRQAWPGKEVREFGPADAQKSVILLHGFGDTDAQYLADMFSILKGIEDLRLLLPQAPEETLQNQNMQAWFLPTEGQWILDNAVATPTSAYLHAMIRREIGRGVSPSNIILGGFAQGGGVALRAALSFPDAPLGGAIVLSSFFGAPTAAVTPANKGLKVLVCHGRDDEQVPFTEGERIAKLLPGLLRGADCVTLKSYEMKHGVATDEVTDVLEFLRSQLEAAEKELEFDPLGMSEPSQAAAAEDTLMTAPADKSAKGVPGLDPVKLAELMDDGEILEATKDPEVMAVMQDVIMFPENIDKHVGNPRVAKILDRMFAIVNEAKPTLEAEQAKLEEKVEIADTEEYLPSGKKKKVRVPIRGLPGKV